MTPLTEVIIANRERLAFSGSVTVRAAEAEGRSYDEVVVTITARPVPTPTTPPGTPAAPGAGGKKAELGEEFADPDSEPEEAFA